MRLESLSAFFLALGLLAPTACNADDFMLARTQKNLEKLRSYHGTIAEDGVLPGETMVSEVWWKRPAFLSRVTAPEIYAGVTMLYTGPELTLYYPKAGYAIRFENLLVPGAEEERQLVADAYQHNLKTYRFDFGATTQVARLSTVTMRHSAKRRDAFVSGGSTQVYDPFSFSLAGVLNFFGGARYSYQYRESAFNQDVPDTTFRLELPKSTILSRWDMASPNLTETALREQANFEIALMRTPPAGMHLEKIIREAGPVPAFTIIYRKGPHFLFHTLFKETGLRPVQVEHGVLVSSPGRSKQGHLLVSPTFNYFGFTHKGVRHLLLANIPVEELAAAADLVP